MPDWITHILSALIIAELLPIKRKSLLVLGVLLPDFLSKLYLLNMFIPLPLWLTARAFAFHTIIPLILASILTTFLFYKHQKEALILIPAGALLHLLLDATTKHYFYNPWWAFFWADQYWIVMIILALTYLAIKLFKSNTNKVAA